MPEPKVVREGSKATIIPVGDLVASTSAMFSNRIKDLTKDGALEVVVDLSEAEMIDSSGIGAMISAHKAVMKIGGTLAIINASPDILDLLTAMRIDQIISLSGS